ncbi:MAG: DUF58 domain-containing protein [SAR202 cluster bacterium]|nr:DUF58 domain-containing protein [SAR202 cluster bacterium]
MRRLITLVFFLLLALVLALATGYRPLYLVLYTLVSISALAYLWAWIQTRGLEAAVENLTSRPHVGQPILLKVTLRDRWGLPRIALRVQPDNVSLETQNSVNLRPRGSFEFSVNARSHHRGYNPIGRVTVTASDPLGIAHIQRRLGSSHDVLVYPEVIQLTPGLSVGSAALGHIGYVTTLASASTSASRVREYHPGDSLSHIHWPTTARRNSLMTKEFDSGGHSEVWIFVDLQGSNQAGTAPENTEEYSITIAASIAYSLIDQGQLVGLAYQGAVFQRIAPKRTAEHLWDVLTALAVARAQGSAPIAALVENSVPFLAPGSVVLAVASGSAAPLVALGHRMERTGASLVPVMLDPSSFAQGKQNGAKAPSSNGSVPVFNIRQGDNLGPSLSSVMDRLIY